MRTVLKIPLYLSVETENIDRLRVTSAMQKEIIPQIVRLLASVGNKISFSQEESQSLQKQIGPFDCQILTDIEAMAKKG